MLTQDRLREVLYYDRSTGIFTWLKQLSPTGIIGSIAGSINAGGYRQAKIDRTLYYVHRLAWLYMTGEWPAHEIDHINLNKDDNRWENIRPANRASNVVNRAVHNNNISGIKGVYERPCGTWAARIGVNHKTIYLGTFKTAMDANAAYTIAAAKYFGEFARGA